jgi:predicted acetyltransferase
MAELEVRPLREGELHPYLKAVSRAFGEELADDDFLSGQRVFEPERVFVAADGEAIVGGGASFSFQLTVPGGATIGAAGVTAVGTLPTHRRRGALKRTMRLLLEDARQHGDPVAILWASQGSIYQRFGYGIATVRGEFDILQSRAVYRTDMPPVGSTRLIDTEEAKRLLPPVYEQLRARTPGFISRTPTWWESEILSDPERWRRGAGPKAVVVHEVDGVPDGYLIYRVKNDWDAGASKSTLIVRELMGTTPQAQRELWRFCFGHDLIHTVRAHDQPPDHPLMLMLAEPALLRFVLGGQLWLRIVDVAAALEARSYTAADRVVLELTDAFLPELAGRWLLDTNGDRPRIERTDAAADLALDVTDLACLYLGAFSATELAEAGRTSELNPGIRERLDGMFRVTRKPWCPTGF